MAGESVPGLVDVFRCWQCSGMWGLSHEIVGLERHYVWCVHSERVPDAPDLTPSSLLKSD